jgi:BlaI family penicillinase repressor
MPGGTLDISGAEWEVMRSIWQARGPIPAAAVVAAVAGPCDWSPRTVKTLLNRLVKKKALGFEARGKVYWYYPLVAQEKCLRHQSTSFLRRVFGGDAAALLVHFVKSADLSPAQIAELRRVLQGKDKRP